MNQPTQWHAAHTRPRCEKKLAQYAQREGLPTTLPTIPITHQYPRNKITFHKPLFPGYLFLQLQTTQRQKIIQSNYTARLLNIPDQQQFQQQLNHILTALQQTQIPIRLAPQITQGTPIYIKRGPLRGLEGWVEKRKGPCTVQLRLDFIGQAATLTLNADDLHPI